MLTTCKEAVKNSGHVHQNALIDPDVGHHTLCFTLNLVHMSCCTGCPPKKFPTDFRSLLDQFLPGVTSLFFQHSRVLNDRPSQLAKLSLSPELFSHSVYVKLFVKFATKVPYLTFCDKFLFRKWIEREEKKTK